MDKQYIRDQFIPKSRKLKIIYGILWVLEPGMMAVIMAYKLTRKKNNVQ